MIAKDAIEKFLNRDWLSDSRRMKLLRNEDLDERLEVKGIVSTVKLRRAQKISLLLGMKYSSYLFSMDMGGGKTVLSLTLFLNRKLRGKVDRMLVLVPNTTNLFEWEAQAKKHVPELVVKPVTVVGEDAVWELLEDKKTDVVVMTYHRLMDLCSSTVRVQKASIVPGASKGGNRWKHDQTKTDRIARLFQMLVADESTKLRNSESLPFRVVRRLRKTIHYAYLLTGTPFGKKPEALWSQFYLIDFGEALGETYGLFREAFFRKKEEYFGVKYIFRKRLGDELHRHLAHCSIRFSQAECQDLPPVQGGLLGGEFMLIRAQLSGPAAKYYETIEKEITNSQGQFSLMTNSYMRARMVSSGWMGAVDSDSKERVDMVFKKNPKLDALLEKIEELDDSEQLIMAHWFRTTGDLLMERLKGEKMSAVGIYGEGSPAKVRRNIEAFKAGDVRILVGSTKISYGLNLQQCRYLFFFETPEDPIDRKQFEARIVREVEGEKPPPRMIYDAVCTGTKDEKILNGLRSGKSLSDLIVDGKKTRRA